MIYREVDVRKLALWVLCSAAAPPFRLHRRTTPVCNTLRDCVPLPRRASTAVHTCASAVAPMCFRRQATVCSAAAPPYSSAAAPPCTLRRCDLCDCSPLPQRASTAMHMCAFAVAPQCASAATPPCSAAAPPCASAAAPPYALRRPALSSAAALRARSEMHAVADQRLHGARTCIAALGGVDGCVMPMVLFNEREVALWSHAFQNG